MSEEQLNEFKELAKPLVKFLNENFHPHVVAIIAPDRADLYEANIGVPITEYLPK